MSVYIVDEIMGTGKTSALINYINRSGEEKHFLFVTPYLQEVERIKSSCPGKRFVSPDDQFTTKSEDIKRLIRSGENIATTHALFRRFDDDTLTRIRESHYTLVMDEVVEVVEKVCVSSYDAKIILRDFVEISDNGRLVWVASDYSGKYTPYRKVIEEESVYRYSSGYWIKTMPKEMFLSFENVFILTYMFHSQIQRCYFDLVGIGFQNLYVTGDSPEAYQITEVPQKRVPLDYSSLIQIDDSAKLNRIGAYRYSDSGYIYKASRCALSKGWYASNYDTELMDQLKNNTYNFFHNKAKTPANRNMWTSFLGDENLNVNYKRRLAGKGYTKGFVSCNARGTNEFRDRTSVAYLVNRYFDPNIKNFFVNQGISVDEDGFALSEMLQWIWRSAIRDGKEIYAYIPSERMRTMLIDWMEKVSVAA